MCLNCTGDTTQTDTEILNIVLPEEVSLAQKNDQTTKYFSKCDTGYLFCFPSIFPPVFSTVSAY